MKKNQQEQEEEKEKRGPLEFPNTLRSDIDDTDWSIFTNFLAKEKLKNLGDLASAISLADKDAQSDDFRTALQNMSLGSRGKLWNALRTQRYQQQSEATHKLFFPRARSFFYKDRPLSFLFRLAFSVVQITSFTLSFLNESYKTFFDSPSLYIPLFLSTLLLSGLDILDLSLEEISDTSRWFRIAWGLFVIGTIIFTFLSACFYNSLANHLLMQLSFFETSIFRCVVFLIWKISVRRSWSKVRIIYLERILIFVCASLFSYALFFCPIFVIAYVRHITTQDNWFSVCSDEGICVGFLVLLCVVFVAGLGYFCKENWNA